MWAIHAQIIERGRIDHMILVPRPGQGCKKVELQAVSPLLHALHDTVHCACYFQAGGTRASVYSPQELEAIRDVKTYHPNQTAQVDDAARRVKMTEAVNRSNLTYAMHNKFSQ